ncbi:hypothetical protein [Jiella mangrovi]|uniref:PhnA-like protein n=1 Tax=Jiella mangrovi TaxID=2821407 RepID=A0ABS4BJ17_9HYPH|nr:hypothetical protein [Jiella mangrovi]MBP0616735.1 hypothetical protein [Jiella mangrovi]
MEAGIADLSGTGREKRLADSRIAELGRDRASAPAATLKRISWGGILAGAILALMIQFMLGLFGLGIGLSSPMGGSAGVFSVAGLWAVLVVLVGVFAGAFAAARFAGIPSRIDGVLHGVVTWAVTGLLALYLLTSGAAALVGGAFGVLGQSVDDMTRAAQALTSNASSLGQTLRPGSGRLFMPAPASNAGEAAGQVSSDTPAPAAPAAPAPSAADRDAAYAQVVAGAAKDAEPEARAAAVDAIAETAGVARPEAERRFDTFAERYAKARSDMETSRDAAARDLGRASLAAFVAMVLGMLVGAVGGLLGTPGRLAEARAPRH